MRKKYNNNVSWEKVQQALKENFGFWDKVKLNEKQEERLLAKYNDTFKGKEAKLEKSEYAQDEPLAAEAKRIIDEIALVGLPVFGIGAGADLFQGRIDNTEIPIKIAKAAGYTAE